MDDLILTDVIDEGEKRKIVHAQDVSTIINANTEMKKNDGWTGGGKDVKLAARVPYAVWLRWEQMGITEDPIALKRAIECHQEYKTTNKKLI